MTTIDLPLTTSDIHIRDPFIVADRAQGLFYMYAQSGNRANSGFLGVEAYASPDLERWSRPTTVLTVPREEWALVWAPEVHQWRGKWYLFVTLTGHRLLAVSRPVNTPEWPQLPVRGTHVFVSDSPRGPFTPLRAESLTPPAWGALDGTLHVEDGVPYMVFCHEWSEIVDGTIEVQRLSEDLAAPIGAPRTLFKASAAPGVVVKPGIGMVTDGPFLHRLAGGGLLMLWSTFIEGHGYTLITAHAPSGTIFGPWSEQFLVAGEDGGHGMLFRDFAGNLLLSLHRPNSGELERLHLFRIGWQGDQASRCVIEPWKRAASTKAP